ncbi:MULTISPECIES: type II toxin-antitoxin system MqsR family toxin [Bacillus subtilis group]|uniref:type II toxin-antitoxin system MqsR family toxin n=1 Tax=Bacillus subtilis group TaxID=653685 RepID=UPI001E412FC9|nr:MULTISPECIES: hypothetical protein [Bacillus subtilis group]MCU9592229.1 hypothetical protein [Bacillus velezensis]
MGHATIQSINTALLKIKESIEGERIMVLSKREKNRKTLEKLGFMSVHVIEEIKTLTYKNYLKGPEQNKSRTGNVKGAVWKFGKKVEGLNIYIKIHVIPISKGNTQTLCISFHEDEKEKEFVFPYANSNFPEVS